MSSGKHAAATLAASATRANVGVDASRIVPLVSRRPGPSSTTSVRLRAILLVSSTPETSSASSSSRTATTTSAASIAAAASPGSGVLRHASTRSAAARAAARFRTPANRDAGVSSGMHSATVGAKARTLATVSSTSAPGSGARHARNARIATGNTAVATWSRNAESALLARPDATADVAIAKRTWIPSSSEVVRASADRAIATDSANDTVVSEAPWCSANAASTPCHPGGSRTRRDASFAASAGPRLSSGPPVAGAPDLRQASHNARASFVHPSATSSSRRVSSRSNSSSTAAEGAETTAGDATSTVRDAASGARARLASTAFARGSTSGSTGGFSGAFGAEGVFRDGFAAPPKQHAKTPPDGGVSGSISTPTSSSIRSMSVAGFVATVVASDASFASLTVSVASFAAGSGAPGLSDSRSGVAGAEGEDARGDAAAASAASWVSADGPRASRSASAIGMMSSESTIPRDAMTARSAAA
mmetsp:Transcript_229/g.926  ORF Transcript_229/g.926 Transcript_229/m.926 type:complete len:478 (+) Transcript_229:2440-3873(+)